jgi:fructoselysine-6-P-deglycase FrlB-like protein
MNRRLMLHPSVATGKQGVRHALQRSWKGVDEELREERWHRFMAAQPTAGTARRSALQALEATVAAAAPARANRAASARNR